MYRTNPRSFEDDVLTGPDGKTEATIKLSFARLFNSKRIRQVAQMFRLNDRETEALVLTVKGVNDVDAGKALNLSQHTIRLHRYRMYAKLGVTSAERAVLKFVLSSGICLSDRDVDVMEGHLRKKQESTMPEDEVL